jgi:hypothetical protein|nr:MAG TPA: terminase small subunit [Caudoviricetes sp.]
MVGDVANEKYQEWLTPDGLTKLEGWARDGLTDEQIASNMGIRRETLINWKKKYDNISNALKRGKEVIDIQVENALLKRALGYSYTETRIEESERDGQKIVKTIKNVPPDTTAQIFWLKNRKAKQWRDRPETANDDGEVRIIDDL